MTDRKTILTWLEICGKNKDCSLCCPYSNDGLGSEQCCESLMADAFDLLKEQETLLKKSYELLADMEMDFFCDDLMCDDGWCDEHCTTNGPTPECIERWLRKQISEDW